MQKTPSEYCIDALPLRIYLIGQVLPAVTSRMLNSSYPWDVSRQAIADLTIQIVDKLLEKLDNEESDEESDEPRLGYGTQ